MAGRPISVLMSLGLLACAARGRSSPPAPAPPASASTKTQRAEPAASAKPPPVLAVARDLDLLVDGGRRVHVDLADVLEWRTERDPRPFRTEINVRVRLRMGEHVLEGVALDAYGPGQGIGLFAAREIPILSETRTALGRALPGAFFPLVDMTPDVGRQLTPRSAPLREDPALVTLPPFHVQVRIARDALTTVPSAIPPPPVYPNVVENRRLIIESDDGYVIGNDCMPFGVLGEVPTGVRVAQFVAGIEMVGIAKKAGESCSARVVETRAGASSPPPVPAAWERVKAFRTMAFAHARDFYLLDRDEETDAPMCSKMSFVPHALRDSSDFGGLLGPPSGGTLTTTSRWREPALSTGVLRDTTIYELGGAAPALAGPTTLVFDLKDVTTRDARGSVIPAKKIAEARRSVVGCSRRDFTVVGETDEGLVTLYGVSSPEALIAYHPGDVFLWYTRREACEAVIARAGASRVKRFLLPMWNGC